MAETIDWEKPYGTIFGGGRARYDQGGKFFDVHGKLVVEEPAVDPKEAENQKEAARQKEVDELKEELAQVRQELEIAQADPKGKKVREAHEAEVKKLQEELAQVRKELEQAQSQPAAEAAASEEQGSLLDDQIAAQGQVG